MNCIYDTSPTNCNNMKNYSDAIDALVYECHKNAVLHGFHEETPNFGEKIALIHSEISEAVATHRDNVALALALGKIHVQLSKVLESARHDGHQKKDEHCPEFSNLEVEMADAVIRIFDTCGLFGLRLGPALMAKHDYNRTRPYKHGKKF